MIKGYGHKLENLYSKIRNQNLMEQKKRINEISKTYPQIIALRNNLTKLSFKLIKSKDLSEINDIKINIKGYRDEIKNLLSLLKLPHNYLDNIYTCITCKDTGYILDKKCPCYYKNLSCLYLEDSELKLVIEQNNFDNFDFSYFSNDRLNKNNISPNQNIKNIYSIILNYIKNFKSIDTNLLLLGECGSGKTFLTHCIAKELLDKGFSVVYKSSSDIFMELSRYYSSRSNGLLYNNIIEESLIMQCDLLIIDDLGAEMSTINNNSYFFNFINKKLYFKKKLIISTNLSLQQLQNNYSDRISSRLFGDFSIFNLFVDQDIRIQKRLRGREL